MSWSNFTFDVFTPLVYSTLTTTDMVYTDTNTVTSPLLSCQGSCPGNNSCKDKICDCTVSFGNYCGSNQSVITTTESPLSYLGNDSSYQCGCCDNAPTNPPSCVSINPYAPLCQQTQTQTCAKFDDKTTCTLGSNGIGTCLNETCIQQTISGTTGPSSLTGPNWSSNNTQNAGWVACQYSYDFSKLSYETFQEFANWLNDIWINGKNSSAPNGISNTIQTRIRDTNFTYACILDFYNQLYNTGFYISNPGSNKIQNYDFLSNTIQLFVQGILTNLGGMVFNSTTIPTNLQNALLQACQLPVIVQNGDQYSLSVNLSYSQLQNANSSGINNYVQNCLQNFLQDSKGTMRQSGQPINFSELEVINSIITGYSAIQIVNENGSPSYIFVQNINPSNYDNVYYPGYIFATVQISCIIEQWSPMLLLLGLVTNPSLTFSPTTCEKIASQISTIPTKCIETCNSNCIQQIENFCQISYSPPSNINPILSQQQLFSEGSEKCHCYDSFLVPAGDSPSIGNFASMCFANSCDSSMKTMFGLTDQYCATQCQKVGDWAQQGIMKQPSDFDTANYNRICGYIPTTTPNNYNSSVLTTGIIMTILTTMLAFSICKHKNFEPIKTVIITFIVFAIFSTLTGFFTRDLAGIGFCQNTSDFKYKFECQSRISKISLPSYFCNYQEACECVSDSDCPTNCNVCASTFCIPSSGNRQTETVEQTQPNIIIIIFSVLSSLIIPFVLIYFHDDYHWGISKKIFSFIAVSIGIIGLIFTIVQAKKKYSQTVPVGACNIVTNTCNPPCKSNETCNQENVCVCNDNPCLENQQCGTDGCGNSCGTCPTGYICNSSTRTCIGPASFTIGYTDSNNNSYILVTEITEIPKYIFLLPINQFDPNKYLSTWIYDPSKNLIYIEPSPVFGNQIFALVAGGQSASNYCDPYPKVGGVPYVYGTGQPYGDYNLYLDVYNSQSIYNYGLTRFERWTIFSNGVIQDMQCFDNNNQPGRCIAVYIQNENAGPVLTTTSPWNLKCSFFSFNPLPPEGVFSTQTPVGSVLACPVRDGSVQNCPQISVDTANNQNPYYNNNQSPVCGVFNTLKNQPHPQWSNIVNEFGQGVCGVSSGNTTYQNGCCNYLGDSCFNPSLNTWCNQINPPSQ